VRSGRADESRPANIMKKFICKPLLSVPLGTVYNIQFKYEQIMNKLLTSSKK